MTRTGARRPAATGCRRNARGGAACPTNRTGTDVPSGFDIAVVGMAGRFPGARSVDELWRNLAGGVESISFFSEDEVIAAGVDPALARDPRYVKAGGVLDGIEWFDAGVLRIYAARSGDHGSAAARVPRVRVGSARARRLRQRAVPETDRRLRRHEHEHLRAVEPDLQSGRGRRARRGAGRDQQPARSPGHARVLQAGSARPELHGADRLLDLARRGASRLPGAPRRRMRHGARRRRVDRRPAERRLPVRRGRHPLARRPLPRVRRRGRGHDRRVRRRRRRAEAARGCAGGRRPGDGGHQGDRRQQ